MENLKLFKKKKEMITKLYEHILKETDISKKIDLFENLMKIDNTDESIVLQYLKFCIEINGGTHIEMSKEMAKDFNIYINYIPPDEWNKNFSVIIKKEKSSVEKLESILQKIASQNWIKADKEQKIDFLNFFRKNLHQCSKNIGNTSFITWKNAELFI